MADENSGAESHSAAESVALGARGPLDPRAASYLEKQGRLADLQAQNLIEQNAFELSHLRWRRFSDQMSGALQMMLAGVALLIVIGLIAAIWNAANDNGLVVESFSVPPDLAAKGLTGDVIASKVLDRLASFQAQTTSYRASASYANNWGDDIKVQIPNTGVSIGEFNRALHQWLGHETHISGEVYRTPSGIALSARVGGDSTPVFKGDEANIDALIDKVAETIYHSTQPYRYAAWLAGHKRLAESSAVLQSIVDTGDARERAWAYNGLAHNTISVGDVPDANEFTRKAIASDPTILLPQMNLAGGADAIGQDEEALSAVRMALKTAQAGDPTFSQQYLAQSILLLRKIEAELTGDFASALEFARKREKTSDVETARQEEVTYCGALHDWACYRAAVSAFSKTAGPDKWFAGDTQLERETAEQEARASLGDWSALLKAAPPFHAAMSRSPAMRGFTVADDAPLHALALAHTGDIHAARAVIASTPRDCVPCLRIRGKIDALDHDWNGAAFWFARAVTLAPSIPAAYSDWGVMLLAKGDADSAIAKFAAANKLGPHFADPLEGWGEALMEKNRSDLAVAKFAEAAKNAPNWARLHMKWAEALWWSGDLGAAHEQVAIAERLDPTAAEKSELMRLGIAHGR